MMALGVLMACGGQGAVSAPVPAGYAFAYAPQNGLAVMRPSHPLTYSDGVPAKRAALAYCAARGRLLNPAAFGRYVSPAWHFAGGCL